MPILKREGESRFIYDSTKVFPKAENYIDELGYLKHRHAAPMATNVFITAAVEASECAAGMAQLPAVTSSAAYNRNY